MGLLADFIYVFRDKKDLPIYRNCYHCKRLVFK